MEQWENPHTRPPNGNATMCGIIQQNWKGTNAFRHIRNHRLETLVCETPRMHQSGLRKRPELPYPPAMERKGHGRDQRGGHRIMVGLLRQAVSGTQGLRGVPRDTATRVQTRFGRQRRDQTRDTPATTTALRAASTVRVGSTQTVERLLRASARSMAIGVRVRRIATLRKRGRRMGRLGLATRHRHGEKVGAMGGRP